MTQNLQNRKDALKRNLKIFNEKIGKVYYPEEIKEMFKLIDTLDETEFDSLNYITILISNDAYECGYNNGVHDEKQEQKKKRKKKA